ncbi:hypothetical protein [Nakamurella panacisegetis]|uniref:hypothetical protein n=1 Tax=Nakamurella panacisegetis TaxID=1090615 RepID=UPI0012FE3AFD|nr:hypothetical protein [Nakamurella panacisegetis]
MRPRRSRSALAVFPLLLVAAVLLTACRHDAGVAVAAGGASDSTDAASAARRMPNGLNAR